MSSRAVDRESATIAFAAWRVLLAAALTYAGVSSVLYIFQDYPRHRVESAWLIFGVLLVATSLAAGRAPAAIASSVADRRVLPAMLLGALLLYLPSLTVGMLSDDFVLLAAAEAGNLWPAGWQHVRPVPLALWALVTAFGAGAPVLHGLNLVLHGLTGYLTDSLGTELGVPARGAVVAGALFVAHPSAVEAVTWLSGIQDVLMASLVMGYLVAALRGRPWLAMACLVVATLTKESAVCAPLLLLVLGIRRQIPWTTLAASAAWAGAFAVTRLYVKPADDFFEPVTGYFAKEFFVSLFGSLAMPFTRAQLWEHPWSFSALVLSLSLLMALAIVRLRDRDLWRTAALGAGWAFAAALPVYSYFHVSPDLQGSRYLYLPAVGWCLLLASAAFRVPHATGRVAILVLLAGWGAGTFAHQQRWRAAAAHRDVVLDRAAAAALASGCGNSQFRSGPDSHAGAYVFRNGIGEAAARSGLSDTSRPVDCVFDWQESGFVLSREGGPRMRQGPRAAAAPRHSHRPMTSKP